MTNIKNIFQTDDKELTDEEKKARKQQYIKRLTEQFSVIPDEESARVDREIAENEEKERMRKREDNFLHTGIEEKYRKTELKDLVQSGMAKMTDSNGVELTDVGIFYDFISDIANGKPRSLWLCGEYGTGKTALAVALMHELCRRGVDCSYYKMHEVMNRLEDVKCRTSRETRTGIIHDVCCTSFRILDEIGRWIYSDWEKFYLFDITNRNYEKFKSSIYISNLKRGELAKFLGGATVDRFRGMGMTLEFTGDSFRGTDSELYTL